jgi:hypothetical protein
MDAFFGMFGFDPGLKKPGGHLLMAVHAESRVHIRHIDLRAEKRACDKRQTEKAYERYL